MITILYVDDEEILLTVVKLFLEQNELFSVDTNTSASAALKLLQSKTYDAIISDYQIPGMDGIEFLKQVRKSGNNIPFILFTGRGREEVVIQALNEGADYYLQKGGDSKSLYAELSHKIRLAVQKRQAEEALETSEERYRAVVEDQTELICRFTPDGRLTFVNEAYCRYFNLDKNLCLFRPHSVVLPPEDAILMKQHLASLSSENTVALIEHRICMPDGSIRWQRWNDRAIFGKDGHVIEYQSVGRDVTERRLAEEEVIKANEYLSRQTKIFSILNQVIISANQTKNLQENLNNILRKTLALLDYDSGGIYIVDSMKGTASIICDLNIPDSILPEIKTVSITTPPYHLLFIEGKPVITDNYEKLAADHAQISGFHSLASVPVISKDRIIGAINVASKKRYIVTEFEKEALVSIGRELGNLIEMMTVEEALQKSEEKYHTIIETAQEGIIILDADYLILFVNSYMTEMLGYTPEEMMGRNYADFLYPGEREDHERVAAERRKGIAGKFERIYLTKSGVKVWGLVSSTPILKDHIFDGSFAMVSDITERKQIENALRESEERFRLLFNSSNDAKIVHRFTPDNQPGQIVEVNETICRRYGYSRDELLQMRPQDLDADNGIAVLSHDVVHRLMTEGHATWEGIHITKDGRTFPVEIVNTVFEQDGEKMVLASARDISERKLVEATLLKVNRKLNVISHLTRKDLTNDTYILSSILEMAIDQLSGQDHIIATLEKGIQAVRSINETIEYSKDYQDMGAKPPIWQNVKIKMVLGLSHISIKEIQHSIETEDLEIFADPLLEKVCQHLFENTVKHGGHVTLIRVWNMVTPNGVTIIFEDDGIGIPQEKKEQIFLRIEGTRASRRSLIFVREILDITGITITETGEPGKGARFEMMVPKGAYRMGK